MHSVKKVYFAQTLNAYYTKLDIFIYHILKNYNPIAFERREIDHESYCSVNVRRTLRNILPYLVHLKRDV